MKPGPGCARSLSWLSAAALLSTIMLLPCPVAAAGKAAAKGKAVAKAKAAPKKSDSSGAGSSSTPKPSTPYEVPSPASSEVLPSSSTPSASSSSDGSTTPSSSTLVAESPASSEPAASETPRETASEALTEPPKDTPAGEPEAAPVAEQASIIPPEPMPPYVEHLGPGSYPGTLRGIYGGSMWLEPSFHGLQWPVMAKSGVGVSGWFWVDNGYSQIRRDESANTAMWLQQGRAALRVTPTYTNGSFFIQAQAELVANVCQVAGTPCATAGTFDTDDLWIRIGQWNAWDLKVGRFEGWELYHTGMGLDLYTFERRGASNLGLESRTGLDAPDFYGVNWMHLRPQSGLGVGYVAFHAYPTQSLRFELLGELGADNPANGGMTYLGGRPALILDKGWVKAKVGAEYETATGDTGSYDSATGAQAASKIKRTRKGVGGSLQFVMAPYLEFGGNFAFASQNNTTADGVEDPTTSFTRGSVGGFANLRLAPLWIVGGGANLTWQNDKYYFNDSISPNYTGHLQAFVSLQYFLARQLIIKAVVGYARADLVASDATIDVYGNYLYSGRIRLTYLY
jgi:hypothetical protein